MAKLCLSPPKCKGSLKLSLDLFLILYNDLLTHQALDATVETYGLGQLRTYFERPRHLVVQMLSSINNFNFTSLKVAFNETVTICGGVKVTAISSGFSVGSCNWIIAHHDQKLVYMSQSCSLTTHPRELNFRALCNADVLIMTAMIHRCTRPLALLLCSGFMFLC